MESIEQPSVLAIPFANNGTKNTLPTSDTGTGAASLAEGFPILTSTSIADGGIPPSRADMNGLGYIATAFAYLMQCGGVYTYRDDVATAIGGYPLDALLWYIPNNGIPNLLRSTIVNNTNNFNNDSSVIGVAGSGKPWEIVTVSPTNFVTVNTDQTISGAKTFTQNINRSVGSLDYGSYPVQNTLVTKGTTPSTSVGAQFTLQDKNGVSSTDRLASLLLTYGTNGHTRATLQAFRPVSGQTDGKVIYIDVDSSNNALTYAPACDANNSIVTTTGKSKGSDGYYKLGNGLIIQWGRNHTNPSQTPYSTISLPISFTSTNYKVMVTDSGSPGDSLSYWKVNTSRTVDTFTLRSSAGTGTTQDGFDWVAVGY